MNKQLINKYKYEFDYWLNGGELLLGYKSKVEPIEWTVLVEDDWDYCTTKHIIIINDEYVELRKALIEGKTIQIYDVIEQHETDPSLDVYGWRDFKSFKPNSSFTFPIDRYRIKPDEPKFKVGDFVRYIAKTKNDYCDGEVLRVIEINSKHFCFFEGYEKGYHINLLELWTPRKDEWCWFWDKCTPHRPTLRQYDIFPEGYGEENMFHGSEQNPFDFCEPFLNSRPSHLKDK